MTKLSVIEEIVNNDLCIGCGVCAAVCPSGFLKMELNDFGEYKPVQIDCNCIPSCNLCLEVCPFYENKSKLETIAEERFEIEPEIKFRFETGYFREAYVGHVLDNQIRMQCSSGGLTTWLLNTLLKEKVVDAVICVTSKHTTGDKLFDYQVIEDELELANARGSRYYPVEMSGVLSKIIKEKNDNEYAIVGLPCQLFAITLAMMKMKKLRKKIKVMIGLVCGQLPSSFYTDLLIHKSGLNPENTQSVNYRKKEGTKTANNYIFQAKDKSGRKGSPIEFLGTPSRLWNNGFFIHNACNYCTDVFAEVADITFLDAWNKNFSKDIMGNSYILVRRKWLDELLNLRGKDELFIKKVDIDELRKSQKGVVEKKKHIIKGRIWLDRLLNRPVFGFNNFGKFNVFLEYFPQILIKQRVQNISKTKWQKSNKDNPIDFLNYFWFEVNLLKFANHIRSLIKKFFSGGFRIK